MKKWLSTALALALILSSSLVCYPALAEANPDRGAALEAKFDDAIARLGELQEALGSALARLDSMRGPGLEYAEANYAPALAATEEPLMTVTATPVGQLAVAIVNGEALYNTDVMPLFEQYANLYAMYGITDPEDLEMLKHDIIDYFIMDMVMNQQARAKGLDSLTPQEQADLSAQAVEMFEGEIASYMDYFLSMDEEMTEEEARAAVIAEFDGEGYNLAAIEDHLLQTLIHDRLFEAITGGIILTDEVLEAHYQSHLEADRERFSGEEGAMEFEYAMLDGESPLYMPEGYRTVKHILLQPEGNDGWLQESLEYELSDINMAIENDVATDEQIARKPEVEAELQAIEERFQAQVDDVISRLAAGEDFFALMDQFGQDPGMQEEPTRTTGYFVSAQTTTFDAVFVEAAMALENICDISPPARGFHGFYIIRYQSDVTPGPVPLDSIREEFTAEASTHLREGAFDDAIAQWMSEADIQIFVENMR